MRPLLPILLLLALAAPAAGQNTFELSGQGELKPLAAPQPGSEAEGLQQVRALVADGRFDEAESRTTTFIDNPDNARNPYLPEALLLRARARLGKKYEWDALRDLERVVKEYPQSEQFVPALELELDIAVLYLEGLRRKNWLFRLDSGIPAAEEIVLRINERLPGSRLAEKALLILADYYYKGHDLRMAVETYDVFVNLFPKSDKRALALQRRAYANIAQFRGPHYDVAGLIEAKYQIAQFQREFPSQAVQAGMSDALAARVEESTAEQLLETARWYLRRNDPVAARYTLKRLVRRHPLTGAAQESLRMLEERGWGPRPAASEEPQPQPAAAPATEISK